jgi:NAD(P)-dependent dehydrogenase (short-subunit alcohol dehydrogenase family)
MIQLYLTNYTHMPQAEEVAVVTGSSTGMGFETSLMLARNGFHTYATMCKLEDGSRQITDIIFISLLRITLS